MRKKSIRTEGCNTHNKEKTAGKNKSAIYRHRADYSWKGIKDESYKPVGGGWQDIVRKVIIGSHGESTHFHLRYFEIMPGGFSTLERHRHEHVVICVRGKGRILIGEKLHRVDFLDTVYISPNTIHQLTNPFDEPFGFFCIVNAKRDKPKLIKS